MAPWLTHRLEEDLGGCVKPLSAEGAQGPLHAISEWASAPSDQLRVVRGEETIADGVRILATLDTLEDTGRSLLKQVVMWRSSAHRLHRPSVNWPESAPS
jgi:hypothetical protein